MKRRVFFLGKGNFQGKEKKKMQHEKTTREGTLVERGIQQKENWQHQTKKRSNRARLGA